MSALRRQLSACVVVAALFGPAALGVSAADLGRYRGWENTPAAYCMTDEERATWKTITTEAGAETFVAAYTTKRGPQFEQELRRRIEIADRTFSSGRVRGSQTLRGRIIIVLGPPAKFDLVHGPESGRMENADLANIYTNVGPMGSQSVRYRVAYDVFTFTYPASEGCKAPPCRPVVIRIELDPARGSEQLPDKAAGQELEVLLKNAIRSSLKTPAVQGGSR